MKTLKKMTSVIFAVTALTNLLYAGGVEGKIVRTDGSKVNNTATISTSWNGKKAYPKNGRYQLDLGKSVNGSKVTVYVNGYKVQDVRIPSDGSNVIVNITLKGSGNSPVK